MLKCSSDWPSDEAHSLKRSKNTMNTPENALDTLLLARSGGSADGRKSRSTFMSRLTGGRKTKVVKDGYDAGRCEGKGSDSAGWLGLCLAGKGL